MRYRSPLGQLFSPASKLQPLFSKPFPQSTTRLLTSWDLSGDSVRSRVSGVLSALLAKTVEKMAEDGGLSKDELSRIYVKVLRGSVTYVSQNPYYTLLKLQDDVGKLPEKDAQTGEMKSKSFTGDIIHEFHRTGVLQAIAQQVFAQGTAVWDPVPIKNNSRAMTFSPELFSSEEENKKTHIHIRGVKGSFGKRAETLFASRGFTVTGGVRPRRNDEPVSAFVGEADVVVCFIKPYEIADEFRRIELCLKKNAIVISSAAGFPIEAVRASLSRRPDVSCMRFMGDLSFGLKAILAPGITEQEKETLRYVWGDPDILFVSTNQDTESVTLGACTTGILCAIYHELVDSITRHYKISPGEAKAEVLSIVAALCEYIQKRGCSFDELSLKNKEVDPIAEVFAQELFDARERCWAANEKRMPINRKASSIREASSIQDITEPKKPSPITFFPDPRHIPIRVGGRSLEESIDAPVIRRQP